jgi:signal transduction histidine kinase
MSAQVISGRSISVNSGGDNVNRKQGPRLGANSWLLRAKATSVRSPHIWIIAALFAVFTYIYYGVLSDFHDIYIILFFYPLIYAAVVYRLRGVVISGLVFLCIWLPHAFLFAYDFISLTRSLIFALFAFLVSSLWATLLNYYEHQASAYDEILSLNEELNSYIERLKNTQQQLIQSAKLSALGQLSASVAHELNNPLGGVLVYTKLLAKRLGSDSFNKDEALANLSEIESAVNYCSEIIRGLLDFARQSPPLLRPVTVSRAIDKVMSLVGHQAKMKSIEIIREDEPSLPLVVADFNQILQVFVNLVVNAVQSMNEGGRLTIKSSHEDGWLKISFQDDGCGISLENMEKIFTPFFTTREEVKGVGLGLAVSHGIIERHGGRIEVESEVGKGSTFSVYLPVARESAQMDSSQAQA